MKPFTIQPVALHRLLVPQDVQSFEIDGDFLTLQGKQGAVRVDLSTVAMASGSHWLVLRKLRLETPQGIFHLGGLSEAAIGAFEGALRTARRRKDLVEALAKQAHSIRTALTAWEAATARDVYLTTRETAQWQTQTQGLTLPDPDDFDLIDRLPSVEQLPLRKLIALQHDPQGARERRNALYVQRQLQELREFFDHVESNPLTDQQRQAIVHDEDNALVIAGAGTGKTSTLVGKVGFLLEKKWARPEQILLLAYTKDAAKEMRERVARKLGVDVTVRTFHAFGLEILAQASGTKPSLAPEAADDSLKRQTLKSLLENLLSEESFRQDLLSFQSSLRPSYKPAWEFETEKAYTRYLIEVEPRCLSGICLRSYEECEIANWLLLHGVAFEYERAYEVDTASPDYRQYKPDFYLPKYGLYLEHWGVNRDGQTAPFVDGEAYTAKMAWARVLHAENATKLVETYSWEKQEGILLTNLEAKLREQGVTFQAISMAEALRLLNQAGQIDPFSNLTATFLSLFKSAGISPKELHERVSHLENPLRGEIFLRLFSKLFAAYEECLRQRGEIDFDDMIGQAREAVERGDYASPFRYVLIDEFQDMAVGRAKLILALRNQEPGAKLFCVGDDWQSIYRFAGSDIALMTEFERWFGHAHKTALERTFRFHDRIASLSGRFVQENPHQLRKRLSTHAVSGRSGVVIWMEQAEENPLEAILAEIATNAQNSASKEFSVFVLSRYTFNLPDTQHRQALARSFPRICLQAMTVHASKGLEADYVIVDNLAAGKHGFPSEIADDPVLGLVLADGEEFKFAEERRLFYVALTRARQRVFLLADRTNPSSFIRELLDDDGYDKEVRGKTTFTSALCSLCEHGRMVKRTGEFGVFYGCSHYPLCAHREEACSRCKQGRLHSDKEGRATCGNCGFASRTCPRCHTGLLVLRHDKSKRAFWGCSNYPQNRGSCRYTEKINVQSGGEQAT